MMPLYHRAWAAEAENSSSAVRDSGDLHLRLSRLTLSIARQTAVGTSTGNTPEKLGPPSMADTCREPA